MNRPALDDKVVLATVLVGPDRMSECGVRVVAADGGGYTIEWTDFVAQEEAERYDTLAAALARVALLAECATSDWYRMFRSNAADFATAWSAFAAEEAR